MVRAAARHLRARLKGWRIIQRLMAANPGSKIAFTVTILGDAPDLVMGEGCAIEDGAILDFSMGGSIRLGRNVSIRSGAVLAPYGGQIKIGDDSGVNHFTILYGHGGLTVGRLVRFAAHCLVIPANHGFEDLDVPICRQPLSMRGITIGDDVWIGGHVTILDGVAIADGSVVAAGSVVNRDVERLAIAAGSPAAAIGRRGS